MPYKNIEDYKTWQKKYHLNNKQRIKKYTKKYRLKNKDKIKKYIIDNVEKLKKNKIEYCFKNKEKIKNKNKLYRLKNKDKRRIYNIEYNLKYPNFQNTINAKRRAAKLNATPKFANLNKIKEIYKNCPKGYHVDHIVPLQGKEVCGLHVEYNLQYLTKSENSSKSNRFVW